MTHIQLLFPPDPDLWANELGIIPFNSGFERTPSIVNVLPVPVCPYANTVPLYPSNTKPTIGLKA